MPQRKVGVVVKYPELAANLKRLKEAQGLTWQKIATELKMSIGAVEKWKKGYSRPYGDNAVRLARVLRCHPDELFSAPQRPTGPA